MRKVQPVHLDQQVQQDLKEQLEQKVGQERLEQQGLLEKCFYSQRLDQHCHLSFPQLHSEVHKPYFRWLRSVAEVVAEVLQTVTEVPEVVAAEINRCYRCVFRSGRCYRLLLVRAEQEVKEPTRGTME